MTLTPLTILLTTVVLLTTKSGAVQCVNRDGELVLQDNGEDISPGPFDCLRIKGKTKKASTTVSFKRNTANGAKCTVTKELASERTAFTKYTKSEMKTGTYCKYKCVEGDGYKCVKKPRGDVCRCEKAGPRAVTVAVVGGKGPDALGETCDDKYEGYEFADAVACTRIEGPFTKKRLVEVKEGKCVWRTEKLVETRFMRTEKVERNLQGCVYVCKKALIACIGRDDGKKCRCGRVGLRKVLIGMNEAEVEGRVDQTKCTGDDCGPCGVCVKGECELRVDARSGNNCQCGEICPKVDRRKGGKGGKIFCEINENLGCRNIPKWMRDQLPEPGTKTPNYCTSGVVDQGDTCGCAPGYEIHLGKNGETGCRVIQVS